MKILDVFLYYLIEKIRNIRWQRQVFTQNFTNVNPMLPFYYLPLSFFNFPCVNGDNSLVPVQQLKLEKPLLQIGISTQKKTLSQEEVKQEEKKVRSPKRVKDTLYRPRQEDVEGGKKKYKKDENRNIIPNTINQMFSFLEKKFKSEPIVKKIIEKFGFEKICSPKQYYIYQKILKSKLNNYLTKAALSELFELVDPPFEIFTLKEQLCFIKINSILLKYYLRGSQNPCRLLCTQKANKQRKPAYLNASRQLNADIDQLISEAKSRFDFSLIDQ